MVETPPLILSPRIDAKRYNPTTIMHKTSQACAQPLPKAMHKSPQGVCELGCSQDAGAWVPETHTCTRASDTRRLHALPPRARHPREARADVAPIGGLGPRPPPPADPVRGGSRRGACQRRKARPEGKGFRSQSASQSCAAVARECKGSERVGRRARVSQQASYGRQRRLLLLRRLRRLRRLVRLLLWLLWLRQRRPQHTRGWRR